MTAGMSKMGVANMDSVEVSSLVARQRFLDLNKEVVECRVCPRLVKYRESVARVKKKQFLNWNYWGRPVPGFGDISATIVVIGLAPAPDGRCKMCPSR
jgi:uracil-DNA glycosylase